MEKIKVGITHGDVNGIGYELILKTFENEDMFDLCTPIVYGSPKVATYHKKIIESPTPFVVRESIEQCEDKCLNLINCFGEEEIKVEIGRATEDAGIAAITSLGMAFNDLSEGKLDVLVTSPINRNTIKNEDGRPFPGHTEFLELQLGDGSKGLRIMMNDHLRVALVTNSMPLSQVASSITNEAIMEKLETLNTTLKRDFNLESPRIAVLALNPNTGESGVPGKEETEIIAPTIEEAFKKGIRCFGPYAADELFGSKNYTLFDAVLAMYYDQGVTPFKSIVQEYGCNYTAGLPVIRTAPAIGPSYTIAGKNQANEDSFRQAIYQAIDIFRSRQRFDRSHAHPLRRQYYEKRDDSDKLKLDQPTSED